MYKIRNSSLDKIFSKYKVNNLNDLSDDQLLEICDELGVNPSARLNKRNRLEKVMRFEWIKKHGKNTTKMAGTLDRILDGRSISFYMDDGYWETRHRKLATDMEFYEKITNEKLGTEVFKAYADMKIGVYNLRPGEEVVVDITPRFIREVLLNPDFHYHSIGMEITDLDNNTIEITGNEDKVNKDTVEVNASVSEDNNIIKKGPGRPRKNT